MANTPDSVIKTLNSMPEYVERFRIAFPGQADPVTFDNMAKAIEVFEVTLITPNGPFDQWLRGTDEALTESQKAGLELFVDKGCTACHSGVNVGGQGYFPFGLIADFLRSLEGEQPHIGYPVLPVETAATPKPRL